MRCIADGCAEEAELLSSFCGQHRPKAKARDTKGYFEYIEHSGDGASSGGKDPGAMDTEASFWDEIGDS